MNGVLLVSSQHSDNSVPPLPVGALLRFGLEEIRTRIYAGVVAAGFDDLRPAHVTMFRWPGPRGRRPTEVAADVQISKQRVNDLLRDLERLGYLELEADESDNRAKIIHLTSRGKRLQEVALGVHEAIEREWKRTVGSRRYRELREILTELVEPPAPSRMRATAASRAATNRA